MINQKSIEAVRKSIKFKYDEHVGKLISIPTVQLKKIVPNKNLQIYDILKAFNQDSSRELFRYGDDIRAEVFRILKKLRLNDFSEKDKNSILKIVDDYCNPDLYLNRFNIILASIEKKLFSYGQNFDLTKHRIDLPRAICESYARNTTRSIRSKIENDLDCFIESFSSKKIKGKRKLSEVTDCFELKPNWFGIGFNLNAIIDKFCKRNKK